MKWITCFNIYVCFLKLSWLLSGFCAILCVRITFLFFPLCVFVSPKNKKREYLCVHFPSIMYIINCNFFLDKRSYPNIFEYLTIFLSVCSFSVSHAPSYYRKKSHKSGSKMLADIIFTIFWIIIKFSCFYFVIFGLDNWM